MFRLFITRCLFCLSNCRTNEDCNIRLPSNPAPSSLCLLWLKPLVELLYQKLCNATHLLSLGVINCCSGSLRVYFSFIKCAKWHSRQPFSKLRLTWLLGWWRSTVIHKTTAVQLKPTLPCLRFRPSKPEVLQCQHLHLPWVSLKCSQKSATPRLLGCKASGFDRFVLVFT